MRDHAAHPDRVHRDAVDRRATRALGDDAWWSDRRPTRPTRRPSASRGQHRGARRRVDLLVVVQLDDLGGLEVRRRELGEPHHQHGTDREVRRDHRVGARSRRSTLARSSSSASVKPVVPTTAWIALLRAEPQVLARRVDHREVDRDLGAGVDERGRARPRSAGRCRAGRADRGRCPRDAGSTAATSSSSGSACTAAQTVAPMRPPAPKTPTRITSVEVSRHCPDGRAGYRYRSRRRRTDRRSRACGAGRR